MRNLETHTVTLDKIRIGLKESLSEKLLDTEVDIVQEFLGHVDFYIRGYLLGEKQKDVEIEYPADWWQAFKDHFFPEWLKKRYPTKMTHCVLSTDVIYPNLRISIPNEERIFKFYYNTYSDSDSD